MSLFSYPGITHDGRLAEALISVSLDIPDTSKVLQFTNPMVDIAISCDESEQSIRGVKSELNVSHGKRSFTFSHSLTGKQQSTLQKIVVTRIYDGKKR